MLVRMRNMLGDTCRHGSTNLSLFPSNLAALGLPGIKRCV